MAKIFTMAFSEIYLLYVAKLARKDRTPAELDRVATWLTGFDEAALRRHLAAGTTVEQFFAEAPMNPNASLITGMICGIRVEEIEDPLMQKIRYMDKLVDEVGRGKKMTSILRT